MDTSGVDPLKDVDVDIKEEIKEENQTYYNSNVIIKEEKDLDEPIFLSASTIKEEPCEEEAHLVNASECTFKVEPMEGTSNNSHVSSATSTSSRRKPRPFKSQARTVIFNVYKFLTEQLKDEDKLKYNMLIATAEATGISTATVARIVQKGNWGVSIMPSLPSISTRTNSYSNDENKIFSFNEAILRRKIFEFYIERNECPTVRKLSNCLKKDNSISCGKEFLRKKILEIGFRWKTSKLNRKILVEKPVIGAWRTRYLQVVRGCRQEQRPIVYLDETFLLSTPTALDCWQPPEEAGSRVHHPHGERLIIATAGGEMGFIKDALLIDSRDMTGTKFSKWVKQRLIPNLPPHSMLVMDNAAYHCIEKNKKPNITATKDEMEKWLSLKGVPYVIDMTKAQLLEQINAIPAPKEFLLDKMLQKHGHSVLRLPPYHPELNPIKLVWRYVKGKQARDCLLDNLEHKRLFLEKALRGFNKEMWQECCTRIKKIENEYCRNDELLDNRMDSIILNLSENPSSSDSSDESEEEQGDCSTLLNGLC